MLENISRFETGRRLTGEVTCHRSSLPEYSVAGHDETRSSGVSLPDAHGPRWLGPRVGHRCSRCALVLRLVQYMGRSCVAPRIYQISRLLRS